MDQLSGSGIVDENMGKTVAGLGDVNGDGYGDVGVSGGFGDGTYVYYGSSTGLKSSPRTLLSGGFVAKAGDINGDGMSDVLTSDHSVLNGDYAAMYLGGSPTMDFSSDWSIFGDFEATVGPAGDVNGDGFADVVAHKFNETGNPQIFNQLFLGSATGLDTTPDQDLPFTPSQATRAGDVNDDGYDDLITYVQNDTVKIWLGSPTGYATNPAWTVTVTGEKFGTSLAGAGDVNGDGFADVIVGAIDGFGGGSARIYLGGGGDGLEYIPRNRRGDDTGPTALLGDSGSSDRFRIQSRGRTARGRALVGMVHQVAPLGTPLASGTLVVGNFFDTGTVDSAGSDVNFGRLVSGLAADTSYVWRMRFVIDDPIFPRTRWISLPGNSAGEIDIRTSCIAQNWYRDADLDGFGVTAQVLSSCTQPAGYVTPSGDCNDADATMFPGNPEVCDGKDNNCNGPVDDGFAAPTGLLTASASKSGGITLSWGAVALADRYDVVRGTVGVLRGSSGNYTSATDLCVANGTATLSVSDATVPAVADGFWYLVRPVNCQTNGTYDDGSASQQGLRDAEIAASAAACP